MVINGSLTKQTTGMNALFAEKRLIQQSMSLANGKPMKKQLSNTENALYVDTQKKKPSLMNTAMVMTGILTKQTTGMNAPFAEKRLTRQSMSLANG